MSLLVEDLPLALAWCLDKSDELEEVGGYKKMRYDGRLKRNTMDGLWTWFTKYGKEGEKFYHVNVNGIDYYLRKTLNNHGQLSLFFKIQTLEGWFKRLEESKAAQKKKKKRRSKSSRKS